MYCVTNSDNHIIAASGDFIEEVGAKDVHEAALAFIGSEINIDREKGSMFFEYTQKLYSYTQTDIESVMGDLVLYSITPLTQERHPSDSLPSVADRDIEKNHADSDMSIIKAETGQELPADDDISLDDILSIGDEESDSKAVQDEESDSKAVRDEESSSESVADDDISPLDAFGTFESEEERSGSADDNISLDDILSIGDDGSDSKAVRDEESSSESVADDGILSLGDETTDQSAGEAEHKKNYFNEISIESFDLEANAEKLHLETDEYRQLLKDFVNDAQIMKEDLGDEDRNHINLAASILKDALLLLRLSPLDKSIDQIINLEKDERKSALDAFYEMLENLTAEHVETRQTEISAASVKKEETDIEMPEIVDDITATEEPVHEEKVPAESKEEEILDIVDTDTENDLDSEETYGDHSREEETLEEETLEDEIEVRETDKTQETETVIDSAAVEDILKGVEAIPVEFSAHIAAEELSLPEDLVLEFISDFAQQSHDNIPVLIQAYKDGDLDKLQKTAHMLKGAASNLRIEPMVGNLKDLQFDDDISNAPERIRMFAGQLISLDKYLKHKQMNVGKEE